MMYYVVDNFSFIDVVFLDFFKIKFFYEKFILSIKQVYIFFFYYLNNKVVNFLMILQDLFLMNFVCSFFIIDWCILFLLY